MTAPRIRRHLVVAAVLAICAPAPGSAYAVEKAIWGPVTLPDGHSAFALYEELRVDTFQYTLDWSRAAPTRPASTDPADPAYRWPAELDAAVRQADRHGIRVALQVSQTPAWANGGKEPIWAPDDPHDFAAFLTAAARRYPSVRRWMIWGEPNRLDRFQPSERDSDLGPATYARMLDAAYAALKRRSARNIVIGGMTWTGGEIRPAVFIRGMRLADGKPPRLDWFGHNPFPYRFPDLDNDPAPGGYRDMSDIDTFGREIDRLYGRDEAHPLPLWLSEFLIQSEHGSRVFGTFVSRDEQARWLTTAYRIADDERARVRGLGWLSLLDEEPGPQNAHWGLLTHRMRPKPSFFAMQRAPSDRTRPVVRIARSVRRETVAGRGLLVTILPRVDGPIELQLRRGDAVLRTVTVSGRRELLEHARLARRRTKAGRYIVSVRSTSAATVDVALAVR